MTHFWILAVGICFLVWKPRITIAISMTVTAVMLLVVVFVPGATSFKVVGLVFVISIVHTLTSLVVLAIMALMRKPI